MDFALQATTPSGAQAVDLAERHAADCAVTAAEHDRNGSFPCANFEAMRDSRLLSLCLPEEFGGLGVSSVHDFVVAIDRLGRGDGSTAIGANMHISQTWLLTHYWRRAEAAGNVAASTGLGRFLRQLGSGRPLLCSVVAESGTDILHPFSTATPTDGGWLLNGNKLFGTLVPVAECLQVSCRAEGADGESQFAFATVNRNDAGVDVKDNWDALGMRSSGSHGVELKDVFIQDWALSRLGPWGSWNETILFSDVVITLGLVAAFLGIAESAHGLTLDEMMKKRKSGRCPAERSSIQRLIADNEIDLAACRAMVERTATLTDDMLAHYVAGSTPVQELHELMKDFQCTKTFVTRRAVEVVDRSMTACGGASYMSRHPLSRLYRDVRAGSFMQPYSPNEAFEYIGRVALGLDPHLAEYQDWDTPAAVGDQIKVST